MTTRNLEHLFRPASVAVFGASNQPYSIGKTVIRNLLSADFDGTIMPVNPHSKSVCGVLAYPDVAALPVVPDLAVIATPPATVPALIRELGGAGTRAAVVMTTGLERETDADGRLLIDAMLDAAKPFLLRVLGPDSVGIMVPRIGLNASYAHTSPEPGNLAFITEAGGLVTAVLDYAASSGIGFSHFISAGSAADVDFADCLDALGSEHDTSAILLYMESLSHARKFMSAARAAARNKPVLLVKADRHAVQAPPQALLATRFAEPDAVFDAAMRRAGILRVDTIPELFAAVETLARVRPLSGERLSIVTNGRSAGVIAADALARHGLVPAVPSPETLDRLSEVLPDTWDRRNPVDMEENASPERQLAVAETVLDDSGSDALLFIHEPVAVVDSEAVARALVEVFAESKRSVLACWLGRGSVASARRLFAEAGIATFGTPEAAVSAFRQLAGYRRSQAALMQTPESALEAFTPDVKRAHEIISAALSENRGELRPEEVRAFLECYGIGSANGATAETGGKYPLFAGVAIDPVFGPVLVFGQGGPAAEATRDVAVALPPLNAVLADFFVARTRISRLLKSGDASGRRNPDTHTPVLSLALVQLAQAVADHAEIVGLDINPLHVDGAGVAFQDARMRVSRCDASGAERLAIRPYPKHLEETVKLLGREMTLRPIRPEDAPQHTAFFNRLSTEDVRYRFFSLLRQLAQSELARFTQIDYDRDMAFIASAQIADCQPEMLGPETVGQETLGVVRIVVDPDRTRAEFAITVRTDLKGRGLGRILLAKMIRYCRAQGISLLMSEVLIANRGMRGLARSLGFSEHPTEDDDTVELHLDLSEPVPAAD